MYTRYSVRYFCVLFGKSRQAYYEQLSNSEKQQLSDAIIVKLIEEIRKDLPRAGVPKLYHMLKEPMAAHGIKRVGMLYIHYCAAMAILFVIEEESLTLPIRIILTKNIQILSGNYSLHMQDSCG